MISFLCIGCNTQLKRETRSRKLFQKALLINPSLLKEIGTKVTIDTLWRYKDTLYIKGDSAESIKFLIDTVADSQILIDNAKFKATLKRMGKEYQLLLERKPDTVYSIKEIPVKIETVIPAKVVQLPPVVTYVRNWIWWVGLITIVTIGSVVGGFAFYILFKYVIRRG